MALVPANQVTRVAEVDRREVGVARRRDRVGVAGQEQERYIGGERNLEFVVERTRGPGRADRLQRFELEGAHVTGGKCLVIDRGAVEEGHVLGAHHRVVHAQRERIGEAEDDHLVLRRERRKVAVVGLVDQQRQQRYRVGMIGEHPDGTGKLGCAEPHFLDAPRVRVRCVDADRVRAQPGDDAVERGLDVGETLIAGFIGGTAIEDRVDGSLALDGDLGPEGELRRNHPVEDDAAGRVGESTCKMLRDPCPVGDPVEIQAGVAERLAHGFEVFDSEAGCEIARVVRQRIETVLYERDGFFRGVFALEHIDVDRAIHARRLAGAALVDQQYVAIASQRFEGPGEGGVELHRALAGPARERHHRITGGLEVQRRDNRNAQRDVPGSRVVRVQRSQHRPAAGLEPGVRGPGSDAAVLEVERKRHTRQRGGHRQEDEREHCSNHAVSGLPESRLSWPKAC